MLTTLFVSVILSLIVASIRAMNSVFDNAIQDQPEIECGQGAIAVRVRTVSQKPSYIFAKGHFHKNGCHFKQTDHATFHFEECNVNRKREVNPRGMAYSFTVIVQLHPLFITKVDRAYNVRCFYMEENREVDTELQVSDLTTSVLESGHAMPQCSYTLHRDSPNGPVLRYGRVGDIVFHVWDCPSDVYAMLIHNCYILDGQGDEHKVIDENGCSVDDFIIPQLTYSNELTRSFAGASVVNLPDRESVYFSCQVKLCFKKGDYCTNVTPPRCNEQIFDTTNSNKGARGIDEELQNDQLLYTTTGPLATSNTVRILHTAPTISSAPQLQKSPSFIDHNPASIELSHKFFEKSSVDGKIAKAHRFPEDSEQQNNMEFNHEIEGSGENEYLLNARNSRYTTDSELVLTHHTGTSHAISGEATSATTSTATSTKSAEAPATSGMDIVSDRNSTRGRRTVAEDSYNIVDLDVATPQLKILEEGFDLPELQEKLEAQPGLLGDRREEGVCVSALTMWILLAFSLLSASLTVATIIYSRVSSRKMALFYSY